jgi:hypothetical protein
MCIAFYTIRAEVEFSSVPSAYGIFLLVHDTLVEDSDMG